MKLQVDHLVIGILGATILLGLGAVFALEWCGKSGAATVATMATTALGILCPSPLSGSKPQKQEKSQDEQTQ